MIIKVEKGSEWEMPYVVAEIMRGEGEREYIWSLTSYDKSANTFVVAGKGSCEGLFNAMHKAREDVAKLYNEIKYGEYAAIT